jgi:N-acetylglucosaminyldiphosphoundecaprenol N-acetyl-beta-D-mannosaminyltransferase
LAYDDEFSIDHEFSAKASFKDRLGLCLRAIVALLLAGGKELEAPSTLHFWGIDIANTTMNDAIDWIGQQVSQKKKCLLAFVNPACLNIAYSDQDYRRVLQHADRVLPDGIGIKLGCRLLNQSLIANLNGTDLFPRLCKQASEQGYGLFLLGGQPGVAEKTAAAMKALYPGLVIAGVRDGFFKAEEEDEIIERINQSGAAILLAGFGVPKQELWLERSMDKLNPMVCMGVGGLFDYYSGRIPRAPLWLREIGLEWLWRLYQEPGRMWRRYLVGNPLFLYRVWRQRRQG